MELINQKKLQTSWRFGDDADMVELEFTYDLANTLRSAEKQCIKVTLKETEKDTQQYKLTAEEPSFKLYVPLTKDHFGVEGLVTADFTKKIVYFNGGLSVDSLMCPPPVPEYNMVLFNFY